jgi:phosphoribosylformimino-5-aminoimidazole carboxamide ribotide isomerase
MRIISVIDVMAGKVVGAVGGRREEYKPLKSPLVKSPDPIAVAVAFKNLGLSELYVADLDAISSTGRNLEIITRAGAQSGMNLMVDAGFRRCDDVKPYLDAGIRRIVLATETLDSLDEVGEVVARKDAQVIASIDVRLGNVVSESKDLRLPIPDLVKEFEARGASEILLLTLDRVGTARGPDWLNLDNVLDCTSLPVLVGGGVRNVEDIGRLQGLGVSGVLVATAFHKGTIASENLVHIPQSLRTLQIGFPFMTVNPFLGMSTTSGSFERSGVLKFCLA